MEYSIKVTPVVTVLQPLQLRFDELKGKQQQLLIRMLFQNILEKNKNKNKNQNKTNKNRKQLSTVKDP